MLSLPHFTQFYVKSMWPWKPAEPVRWECHPLCSSWPITSLGPGEEEGDTHRVIHAGRPPMEALRWKEASHPTARTNHTLPWASTGAGSGAVWCPGSLHIESSRFRITEMVYFKQKIQRMPCCDNQGGLGGWPFFAVEEPERYSDTLDQLLGPNQSRDGLRSTRAL